ncbi:outer membrane lipoprotein LolB [Psychromonas sp. CNPT3]|uniref:lipoprotein insertase outer membrane protein LolB n=1 Tax=Psychromonas sp. CNPT3 TaxID=314282 RepID=UPI00006E957B|nr:lipoprotein insertase outer membrane protein LolB [Psychromonas sp. CNPT3]AGH81714.1 outer membrane lipoprotein LolB [Psychromonas sp. CNPT3]
MLKQFVVPLFLLLLLSSCAQQPRVVDTTTNSNIPWSIHQQRLNALTQWQFSGKLAVLSPTERHSFNIHWQQSEQTLKISLTNFLGMRVLSISKNAQLTTVIDAKGNKYSDPNADMLVHSLSGLDIPIALLQQWIKGNPVQATYLLDRHQRVAQLTQKEAITSRWSIQYTDYRATSGLMLPYKLALQRQDIRLKFAINQWNIIP